MNEQDASWFRRTCAHGAKILQQRFGSSAFRPDQVVLYGDRRVAFIRMSDGAATSGAGVRVARLRCL